MAGLAALMTRKKRDRRRELEQLKEKLADPVAMAELTGKEHEEAMKAKAAHETIKKMLNGKELLHQKSQKSFDALSQVSYSGGDKEEEDSGGEGALGNAYSAIYIGLILICIGVVITFVGLGEKGFKTVQLKMIGPILCILGFTCIVVKVIHCTFPQLFLPPCLPLFRRKKLGDRDGEKEANLMEKGGLGGSGGGSGAGVNNKDNSNKGSNNSSIKTKSRGSRSSKKEGDKEQPPKQTEGEEELPLTPRVTLLHRTTKVNAPPQPPGGQSNRPRSTIPNYIEASSDEDDFNPETKSSPPPILQKHGNYTTDTTEPLPSLPPPPPSSTIKKSTQTTPPPQSNKREKEEGGEILLSPKGLFL